MTLHLITVSPLASPSFEQCLTRLGPEDALVLLEEAVYALSAPKWQQRLNALTQPVYVLESDCLARGLNEPPAPLRSVDMDSVVELTLKYQHSLTWT